MNVTRVVRRNLERQGLAVRVKKMGGIRWIGKRRIQKQEAKSDIPTFVGQSTYVRPTENAEQSPWYKALWRRLRAWLS